MHPFCPTSKVSGGDWGEPMTTATRAIEITGKSLVDAYNAAVEAYIKEIGETAPSYYEARSFWHRALGCKLHELHFPVNPSTGVFVRADGSDEIDPSATYTTIQIEVKGWGGEFAEKFVALLNAKLDELTEAS